MALAYISAAIRAISLLILQLCWKTSPPRIDGFSGTFHKMKFFVFLKRLAFSAQRKEKGTLIGSMISFRGDLTGGGDLTIEGHVEGKVNLKNNNVVVGEKGYVKGDIYGTTITVEGWIQGNLYAEKQVVIKPSGKVSGAICAPQITLEEGSKFKGTVDTDCGKNNAST